jgi:hypothetical protein
VKIAALVAIACVASFPAWGQPVTSSPSVWLADYTPATLAAAVASGKTTLIYSGGSSTAVANHVEVARYVARRVAEELANALVLPIGSDAAAYESVSGAIRAGGFTDIVIIADEGAGPDDRTLRDLAEQLTAEWQASGVRILHVSAHEERPGQGMSLNADYLRRWASRTVAPERRKTVEDQAELLFVDSEREWLRPDMIAAEDRAVVVPALGKILLEQRVSAILNQVRSQALWQTPAPTPASPQNRLSAIPADRMTEPLRRALAEYREVRPDGLGELGGADAAGGVGNGGPNLWTVYVHLPEILGPLRALHEQVHVNPRISQKLVHFIIMIVARHWTNDIWIAHDEDGIKEGLSRKTVVALEEGRYPPNMAEDEQATYDFCIELLENQRVSDATYARAVAVLGEEGVVQTAVTVSLYSYLSLAVNMAYPESAPAGRLAPFPTVSGQERLGTIPTAQMTPAQSETEQSAIGEKLTHFAMLIVARHWTQQAIWDLHDEAATESGLKPEVLEALAAGRRPPGMTESEEAVYDFCIELLRNRSVSDATYDRMVAQFGERGVAEVTLLQGEYTMRSMFMNVARTPLESGTAPPLRPFPR